MLLRTFCVLAGLFGIGIWGVGSSAIHEILGSVFLLISAVFFSANSVVGAIDRHSKKMEEMKS